MQYIHILFGRFESWNTGLFTLVTCQHCSRSDVNVRRDYNSTRSGPVSLLANEFDVLSVLHVQVNLAAVNQMCVIHEAMNGCKILKIHKKTCFGNVYIRLAKSYVPIYPLLSCQHRVTVTSCFAYNVIRDLESIDHFCINPIHRIGLIHK